jgi:hypothetical protein
VTRKFEVHVKNEIAKNCVSSKGCLYDGLSNDYTGRLSETLDWVRQQI